jgi:hypothetical protein
MRVMAQQIAEQGLTRDGARKARRAVHRSDRAAQSRLFTNTKRRAGNFALK